MKRKSIVVLITVGLVVLTILAIMFNKNRANSEVVFSLSSKIDDLENELKESKAKT